MEHFFSCLGRAVDVVEIQSSFFLMAHINTVDDATMEFHSNVFLISEENIFCLFIEDSIKVLHVLLAIIVAYHTVGPNQSVAAYAGAILLGEFLGFSLEPLAFGFLTGTENAKSAQKEEGVENRFLHFCVIVIRFLTLLQRLAERICQLVGAGGGFHTTLDAFQLFNNVFCFLSSYHCTEADCVTRASSNELHIVDNFRIIVNIDENHFGAGTMSGIFYLHNYVMDE